MTERLIDLHTHTNNSDGSMTASELVRHAKEAGLAAIAITDHDSVGGVAEAMETGEKIGLEVVPGIELSARSDTETHILGYYIDAGSPLLAEALEKAVIARSVRICETGKLLKKLGFDVSEEEVYAIAPGGIAGRAHHARIMAEKGYVESVSEAFKKYLAVGRPAYFNNQAFSAAECVEIIKSCGGYAFLAHPHYTKKPDEELIAFIKELKDCGLDGIEAYYNDYTPEMQEKYIRMASELGLKICGGTDFHARMKPHISIGTGLGNMKIPYSVLELMRN